MFVKAQEKKTTKEGELLIVETESTKTVKSKDYNYSFDKHTGFFGRWGKTFEDDPEYAPSPEIVDMEITTICHAGNRCKLCYKSNTPNGINMSFDTFKELFNKLPKTVTQIAFGVDYDASANPELFKMMSYARFYGVIPNLTVAELDDETADKVTKFAGACAVSRYDDPVPCYETIKLLKSKGMNQVNIHIIVSEENEQMIWDTFDDFKSGKIPGLNAIVLLGLKKKGRGVEANILDQEKYNDLINYALNNDIPLGADSCSAAKLIEAVVGRDDIDAIKQLVDPCESTRFSMYIDVNGIVFPCSFAPGSCLKWNTGINLNTVENFKEEVWDSEKFYEFRSDLRDSKDHNGCERCTLYQI